MASSSAGAADPNLGAESTELVQAQWQSEVGHIASPPASPALSAGQDGCLSEKACLECGRTKTPMWRNGPDGQKSLCNACGVRQQRRDQKEKVAKEAQTREPDDARRGSPMVSVSARRQSLNMLRGRPSHSMGSMVDFAHLHATSGAMPVSPYSDQPLQQKRKPAESGSHTARSKPSVSRKRSCLWFEADSMGMPVIDMCSQVEPLDLIINKDLAGSLGSMAAVDAGTCLCIRPVRVALCKTPQASWPGRDTGEAPFVLMVYAENGRKLALARPAGAPMAACSFSEALAAYLWDSQAGWQLASREQGHFDRFQALLGEWQQHLTAFAENMHKLGTAQQKLSSSISGSDFQLQQVLNRSASELSMRSEHTHARDLWQLQHLGPLNGPALDSAAALAQHSSSLSPHTPLLSQAAYRHAFALPYPLALPMQPDPHWAWPASPLANASYQGRHSPQLASHSLASQQQQQQQQRGLHTSTSGSSELMHQLAGHSFLSDSAHLEIDPLIDPALLASITVTDQALDGVLSRLPPIQGEVPDVPHELWHEDGSDQTSTLLEEHCCEQHEQLQLQHQHQHQPQYHPLLQGSVPGRGSPQALASLSDCMTPPAWERHSPQLKLTARQSSNMAHATHQALRHVGPSSTDSSPRLLHSLSLPSGHCSMPFGPDDMALVGSGLGAAACPPSGAALLSSAGSWPDLEMPSSFLLRPTSELQNNGPGLLDTPKTRTSHSPAESQHVRSGSHEATWPLTPQGPAHAHVPAAAAAQIRA